MFMFKNQNDGATLSMITGFEAWLRAGRVLAVCWLRVGSWSLYGACTVPTAQKWAFEACGYKVDFGTPLRDLSIKNDDNCHVGVVTNTCYLAVLSKFSIFLDRVGLSSL